MGTGNAFVMNCYNNFQFITMLDKFANTFYFLFSDKHELRYSEK